MDSAVDFVESPDGQGLDFKREDEGEDWIKESARFRFKGNTFHASYWKPRTATEPKSLVLVLHGYAEYLCGAYEEAARLLVKV